MKKLYLSLGILMLGALCFSSIAWALDSTTYDSTDKYIIDDAEQVILKISTTQIGTGQYSATLAVMNSVGTFSPITNSYDPTKIVVIDISGSTPVQLTPTSPGVYTLHGSSDPLTSPNIGAFLDDPSGTLSVLCTNTGFHAMKFTVNNNALIAACGTANGQSYSYGSSSYGSDTQCAPGAPSSTAFPTAGSTVTWTCTNGGSSATCSASQAAAPGACGTANGQTYSYGSSSYGTYTQCSVGNPSSTAFPTAGNTVTWTCSNGGVSSGNCSASQTAAPAALPDLAITSFQGPGATKDGVPFNTYITIKNQGAGAAGAFSVKLYWSTVWRSLYGAVNTYSYVNTNFTTWMPIFSSAPNTTTQHDTFVTTVTVNSLAAGQSVSLVIPTTISGIATHSSYYEFGVIDEDGAVTETDKTNNVVYSGFACL